MEKLTQWVRRGVCKGARGLRDSPQYINNIIVSGEAILSAENSGKPLGSRTSARTSLRELTASQGLVGWELAAPPQEPYPLSRPSDSIFSLWFCPDEKS